MADIMQLDVPVGTGLDQPSYNAGVPHPMMQNIEAELERMVAERNPQIGFDLMGEAAARQHVYGLILAKVVYTMYDNWACFGIDGTFDEYVYERFGKAQETIRRYLQVGELFHERLRHISPDILRILTLRPMRDLIAIAQFSLKNRNPTEEEYRELAIAGTTTEVRGLLNKFAGREEAEVRGLKFLIHRADGTLLVSKNGKKENLGFLKTAEEFRNNPLLHEALEKLLLKIGAIEI